MATKGRWRTALAYGDDDSVVIRGYSLGELVGKVSFAEAFLLLALGELPPPGHARTFEAMLVSVLDHGIVPSSIVTRYLASSGTPIQAAVAGGILSFGDTYGGACQQLAERLVHHRQLIAKGTQTEDAAAHAIVRHFFERGEKVPGYGHALHPEGDPRVPRLYAIADKNGVTGGYSRLAQAALGLDMGLDWQIVRALAFIPRSAGLAVHAVEEMKREDGWRHVPNDEIDYDGPPLRPLGRS